MVTALAVAGACSVLTWALVSLTAEGSDPKPPAAPCSYTPTQRGVASDIPVFDAAKASRPYSATLVTNRGLVLMEALTDDAPCAANSFSFLARKGYFDGSRCHRVTTRGVFTLECGDPEGKGKADPGYTFPDENLAGATYPAGTVAMSKAAPGRNGSQFFISFADPKAAMPSHWTPFARVVGGLDIVKEIGRAGTETGSADGRPRKPVVIEGVVVTP